MRQLTGRQLTCLRPYLWLHGRGFGNAQLDTLSLIWPGAEFRGLVAASPQAAWISYSVPRWAQKLGIRLCPGRAPRRVVHLSRQTTLSFFRIERNAVRRIGRCRRIVKSTPEFAGPLDTDVRRATA
jgi:hypothetical protein